MRLFIIAKLLNASSYILILHSSFTIIMAVGLTPQSSVNNCRPLRIAIIGAGIGGLALAVALTRMIIQEHIQIEIYEQAHEVKETGAGIVVWPRTWAIMEHLGVDEALARHLGYTPTNETNLIWTVKKADQTKSKLIFEFYHPGGTNHFHRAVVQETLLHALPSSVHVHLAHRLASYEEMQDQVNLTFENGETSTCDLLVGADGIKSYIRAKFITERIPHQLGSINPTWGGAIAYRTLLDPEIIQRHFPDHPALSKSMMYTGDGNYVITYPISHGTCNYVNFVAMVTDYTKQGTRYKGPTTKPVEKEEIVSHFEGWSEEVTGLFECMTCSSQWAIQYLDGLDSFAVGRVALLGDAAHAMTPNLGSGAGQAIEDAYTLAYLLRKSLEETIPIQRVTEVYTKARQPLANLVLEKSHEMGRLACFHEPGYERINDADNEKAQEEMLERFPQDFVSKYLWWEMHPVKKEVEKALAML
ncbi:hypothetical protein BDQ17DRAFT_1356956 [Cyathus striatus]|nr:hypothetical protein BDQ17DRAFT_1356956 [Cyathus striatus]